MTIVIQLKASFEITKLNVIASSHIIIITLLTTQLAKAYSVLAK